MFQIMNPQKLSEFLDDYDKSFWDGDGKILLRNDGFLSAIIAKPNITLDNLQMDLKKDPVSVGIDFSVAGEQGLSLGGKKDTGLAVDLNFNLDIDAWMHFIFSGAADVVGLKPDNLEVILKEYIALQGDSGLVVLTFDGAVNGRGETKTPMFTPQLNVGFNLEAGGGYTWAYLKPVQKDARVIDAIKKTFATARLPQTKTADEIHFDNNELLLSRYTGFLTLGAQTSFGYNFTGSDITEDFAKPVDLKTKLTLQAQARLAATYQLAGAFQIIVTDVKVPERDKWVRVVVEKDQTSTFDVAFGVQVGVQLDTENEPHALALFDAILGTSTEQVLKKALAYATDPEITAEKLKAEIDGFTKGIVESWTGRIFDEIEDDLAHIVDDLKKIRAVILRGEEYLVGLYEKILDIAHIETQLESLIAVLESDTLSPDQRRNKLLKLVADPNLKALLEHILDRTFGDIFTHLESVREDALNTLQKLYHLATGHAKEALRKFIHAKQDALGLTGVFKEIDRFQSVDDFRNQATDKLKAFVNRLIDGNFDQVMHSAQAKTVFAEIKMVAGSFNALLTKADGLIKNALNAKGRFELSYAYQYQKKNQKLIDVEIDITSEKGLELYYQAVASDFGSLFRDENIPYIKIHSAIFTDSLFKHTKLNVHVFGWDFKETASMLAGLERSVQVGASGMVTVYKMTLQGTLIQETSRRVTELGFILQTIGTVEGVFEADNILKRQAVDALALLKKMDNTLTYTISDPLTSLDELVSYLDLAVQMKVLDKRQLSRLIQSLRKLRDMGMDGLGFGKVGVKYTFSFDPDALANALRMDWSKEPGFSDSKDNVHALQKMFFDRLMASYPIESEADFQAFPVWALYKAGIYKDIEKMSAGFNFKTWKNQHSKITFHENGKTISVYPEYNDVFWAEVMYRRIVDFSRFLDQFRRTLNGEKKITLEGLGDLLRKFVKSLRDLTRRDFALRVLPMLVLNELARRGATSENTDRISLLEITLYDKSKQDEAVFYIPINESRTSF